MPSKDLEITRTDDGSLTLRRIDLDEPYHSRRGALGESRHVFIEAGLAHWISFSMDPDRIDIIEMGFGTGLNALLTLDFIHRYRSPILVNYYSFETRPLEWSDVSALNYCQGNLEVLSPEFEKMHRSPWGVSVAISERFALTKINSSWLEDIDLPAADLVYYDAFGPKTQPELWSLDAIQQLSKRLRPGGIMVTYCAKAVFKRALRHCGFHVTSIPGPPGKREMVRATNNGA